MGHVPENWVHDLNISLRYYVDRIRHVDVTQISCGTSSCIRGRSGSLGSGRHVLPRHTSIKSADCPRDTPGTGERPDKLPGSTAT